MRSPEGAARNFKANAKSEIANSESGLSIKKIMNAKIGSKFQNWEPRRGDTQFQSEREARALK